VIVLMEPLQWEFPQNKVFAPSCFFGQRVNSGGYPRWLY